MANILDGICPEGSILNGLDDLPRSATRKKWFLITRRIIQDNIVTLILDHAAEAEVIEAFTGVGLLCSQSDPSLLRPSVGLLGTVATELPVEGSPYLIGSKPLSM